ADARDLLTKALDRIKEVDPSHQIVASDMVTQLETTYQTTLTDITRRVPVLFTEGRSLSDQGKAQKNLETLNQALAKWEAVAKLNPEYQNIQAELRSLNEVIASLSGEQVASEAKQRIERAKQALQELEEAIKQEDFERYQKSRNDGVEHCAFIRGLTASGLDALKSEAVQLERQLRQTQFPPPVDDWELVMITERPSMGKTEYQVRLKKKGSITTVDIAEGDRDSASGLTVVEVDRENKAFVWVRKPDHRKTKLTLKGE
ncbi:MAG TPA: BTAD domain-containing putative transcriptional regulator, partial [bacterium]|nr:BTAD domain-containing putative transcriptional regulator [bacterium]